MTFDNVLSQVKRLCSISGTDYDVYLTAECNFGQADFSRDINWPFLETKGSLSSVENQYIYSLFDYQNL